MNNSLPNIHMHSGMQRAQHPLPPDRCPEGRPLREVCFGGQEAPSTSDTAARSGKGGGSFRRDQGGECSCETGHRPAHRLSGDRPVPAPSSCRVGAPGGGTVTRSSARLSGEWGGVFPLLPACSPRISGALVLKNYTFPIFSYYTF